MQLPAAFGKYELLERIATGGMAEVFLARSFGMAGFQKRLAIKRLRPELAEDPRIVQMFINEAKIGVHLNHPNVVSVYELGMVSGAHFMAMEHLHGKDLTRMVKTLRARDQRIELPVAVAIVAEACRGLAYAHARTAADGSPLGLVHRDVSPHNLLVTFAGEVKLVDFGIARLVRAATADGEQPTKPGPGGGKYAYMSPEQARGEAIDHRSDIFSAGIVLWELIVGHRLYQDPDPAVKLQRVRDAVVPHPAEHGAPIDDDLWEILQRALARKVEDRYLSAALLEEDLRAWLFQNRHRVGRAEIAALVRSVFPEEANRSIGDLSLQALVEDVGRLDPAVAPPPPPPDPESPLPGRLRHSLGERRPVVVVMVDVDGLTELSARVTPEMLVKRKYQLLRWLRRIVDTHGGQLHRAVDDHVTILFGVPRSRADDVSHALECALQLMRDVSELRRKGMILELAIGVHSGEVTIQQVSRRIRYVARGDTTRLARRLSAVADHGQVLVSARVLGQVEGKFRLRSGPSVTSRGGKPDLPSYLVESRTHGLRGTHRGPWLRRGPELDTLRRALVALTAGEGAAIALVGEVGSGKSRFIREIQDLAARRSTLFFAARCPATTERPLEPLRDLMASVLGVDPEEDPAQLMSALERLGQLGLRSRDQEAMRSLLAAPGAGPERSATWEAIAQVLRGLATDRPVIVAIDEAQHLYRGAEADLAQLVRSVADVPLLVLICTRPPLSGPLAEVCEEVRLGAFTPELQERLTKGMLDVAEVDAELLQLLERTCEGNALYIEEMLKYLIAAEKVRVIEDRAIWVANGVGDADLPHTLQALITSRIDALDPAAKGLLQLAAVAGPVFTLELLEDAAGLDPAPLVLDLLAHGLVVREGGEEWAFASELVREAALRATLGVQRRDYHRLIAAAIEKLHADRLEPHLEVLVAHCAEGGRPVDAARYAYRAGMELERKAFLDRARDLYRAGLSHLAKADRNPDEWDARVQGESMLQLRLGAVHLLLGDKAEGQRCLQLSLDLCSESGLPWIEARAHVQLGRNYSAQGRYELAEAHLSQAIALLRVEEDAELEREALEASAVLAFELGQYERAEGLWQQVLDQASDDLSAVARCEVGLANRHLRTGDHERAAVLFEAALDTSRRAGDRIMEGRVLNNIGLLHSWAGRLDEALRYYRAALEVREGIGYTRGVVVNHHNVGDVHFQNGDFARAWVAFSRSRELAMQIGWERGVVLNDVYLAYLDASAGRVDVDAILEATKRARELGDPEVTTAGGWLAGRWLLENDRANEGRTQLEAALEDARAFGLSPMADLIEDALATPS
ncbi:MAG: protein kinase [Myxococcales bacterium]|nr:protein kinase [Myxococcales bacterium]